MNRVKGILAAGTLTGLVLITILALGFGNLGAAADTAVAPSVTETAVQETTSLGEAAPAQAEAVQAWQEYSAELEETVRVLQEREGTYQAQLEAANQTITQLESDINAANTGGSYYDDDDDDHYDHDDDDDEDHDDDDHDEHDEHEDDDD